jgi:LytS/YehU family sensor histidine kinase
MASAVIHLHLWAGGYRNVRTIGPLFFVQGVFGIVLSLSIALIRRISVAVLGALYAAGTVAGLLVAVHLGLFGYRTTMNVAWAETSLVIEVTAVVFLVIGGCLAVWFERAHVRRWRTTKSPEL